MSLREVLHNLDVLAEDMILILLPRQPKLVLWKVLILTNTIVSKIGARSSVVSYIVLDPRTSVKGAALIGGSIDANTGIINPGKNDGDITDGALNLGTASSRFKDAHFSGNITGTLTTAAQTNITSVGTLTSLTSGAHLINASSSAFGGSSVQGFNTDFLVDTGQGYSRHNSYHSGGSNHQFLVNATGSTTNTIALALNKDANATFGGSITASSTIQASGTSTSAAFQLPWANDAIALQMKYDANYLMNIEFDAATRDLILNNSTNDNTANIKFRTGGSGSSSLDDRMTIDHLGRVGIGDPTPRVKLEVHGGANEGIILKPAGQITYTPTSSNFYNGLTFENAGSAHAFSIAYGQGGWLKFSHFDNASTYSELAQLRATGDFYPMGNVVMAQGKGISFIEAADTATGETVSSSVLDDYEEGTFNGLMIPETGSITTGSSDNLCTYTRIGRLVTVQGRIQCSAASNPGGQLYVGNLPFSLYNAGENAFSSAVAVNLYNLASNMGGETVGEMTTTGGARILIRGNGGTTSSVHTAGNKIQANSIIGFTATYPTT